MIDTAGRLHIDETLMDELKQIKELTQPNEILLVVDAMTGQDAVNVADSFNQQLGITRPLRLGADEHFHFSLNNSLIYR